MTAVTIQSNKIVPNEVKRQLSATRAILWGKKTFLPTQYFDTQLSSRDFFLNRGSKMLPDAPSLPFRKRIKCIYSPTSLFECCRIMSYRPQSS